MSNKHCTQCRTDRSNVIMSTLVDKKYQDFTPGSIVYTHDKLGISFDSRETQDKVMGLLRFNCPAKDCGEICGSWKELKRHAQEKHHLRFCDLCTRHKKQFTNEFELYNARDLSKHEREGDGKGFQGHPRCQFCNTRFYSGDELFVHLREQHEKCHVCTQQNPNKPQYFSDYSALETHFRTAHYACMVQTCIDNKFVVFRDEIDLRAHMVEAHPGLYGNKTARTLDLDFGFNKGFQSRLSTVNTQENNKGKAKKPTEQQAQAAPAGPSSDPDAFPKLGSKTRPQFSALSASFGQPSTSTSTPKDTPATIAKRRLDERVRNALNYDAGKFAQFETTNQRFLDSQLDGPGLITEYKRMFPTVDVEEMEAMISDFAKINTGKAAGRIKALNKAWDDNRKESHFPSLGRDIVRPVGSGAWASQTSKKGRSGGNAVGGVVNGGGDESAFPSLPPAPKARFPPVSAPSSRSATPSVNYHSIASTTSRKPAQSLSFSTGPTRTLSSPSLATDDFPALPAAKPKHSKKYPMTLSPREVSPPRFENMTILSHSRAGGGSSIGGGIGSGGSDDGFYASDASNGNVSGTNGGNKKGKGKKKTVLYHIGV